MVVVVCAGSLAARADTPAAPENFAQYLVDHQAELGPFFDKNGGSLVAQAVPYVLAWIGRIMFITLIVGWALDVLLGRGFSMLFAPLLSKTTRAVIYATGRLLLSVVLAILFGVGVTLVSGVAQLETALGVLAAIFVLLAAAVQVGWIYYLYRTDIFMSLLFYVTLVVVHGFTALAISVPLIGAHASDSAVTFIDHTVTPKVEEEAKATRQELATIGPAHDDVAVQAARLQEQIQEAKTEQDRLRKSIEDQKNSSIYLFSQIVKVHARGDLAAAHAQFTDFLAKYPSGPLTGLAKGQLVQVDSEISAQELQKQQAEAAAALAATQARADLLARAARGQVTLSEMRNALIGKSRADVSALLGPPAETASDRWGFDQQMIFNPMTNAKTGLTVYFTEGIVQGVDYYYGAGGAR